MQALVSRQSAAVLAVLFAAGCATKPPTPEEEVSVWLSESPRAIAINVDRELPSASVRTRDHRAGERVRQGAGTALVGAGASVFVGCVGGLATTFLVIITCPVGIVAAPIVGAVGAVAGAAIVKSVDQHHPIDAARGSAPLFQEVNLTALLSEAIVSQGRNAGGHVLRPVRVDEEGKALPGDEALLQMQFRTFGLSGDIGEDPRVALVVVAHASLQTPAATAHGWGEFTYEGSGRRVSEWTADDARLFREEIAIALRTIATQVAKNLGTSPSGSAVSKVVAARAKTSKFPALTAKIVVPEARVLTPPAPQVETPPPATSVPIAAVQAQSPLVLGTQAPTVIPGPAPTPAPRPAVDTQSTVSLSTPAPVLVADQPASKYPVLGDKWVYQHTDLWRPAGKTRITHEILAVKDSEILEALTSDAGVQRFTGRTVSSSISDIREWALAGISIHEFAPYALAYDQLKFGATSGATRGIRWPGDSSREWTVEVTSQSEELVEVPAGRFRAVKVFIAGSRPPSPTARMQRFEMTVWYAQESKRYVKLAFNSFAIAGSTQHQGAGPYDRSLYELVSFTAR